VRKILALLLTVSLVSCVSHRLEIRPVSTRASVNVSSPVKAHLKDGSTVVYPFGVRVTADSLEGRGDRYGVDLANPTVVERIAVADVLGMESYRTRVNGPETVLLSSLAGAGAVFGTALLAVAIFGSCPTVYSADGAVEEAELFSSSIAPLFEGRDIDRLRAQADETGVVKLDVRNEAMETHYINHLQLLEVRHRDDEFVVPDGEGIPTVVRLPRPALSAVNRDGRDVRADVAVSDGRFYLTDRTRLSRATEADMDDWIDITVPVEPGASSAAVVLRARNSLLNTILLYDVMLGPAGAAAIDWLGEDLARVSTAVELGRWHQKRAGLHVSVWHDDEYRSVARVPDSGPISWHDVAAVVPVPAGEKVLRVRLSFLADHFRIDSLGVSFAPRTPTPLQVPLTSVSGRNGALEKDALENMRTSDEKYLQTNPGHAFTARFDAGRTPAGVARTFMLASQGYYTEWIRGVWITEATLTEPFMPSDAAVLAAIRKWSKERESFEKRFLTARVPVQ
jgi:hypothetical protein